MDVSFSPAEIAVIVALLGSVTGPLITLFRLLNKEKDRQIARLEQQLDGGASPSALLMAREVEGLKAEISASAKRVEEMEASLRDARLDIQELSARLAGRH